MKLFIAMCVETAIFCLIFYLLWQFTLMDVSEMLWLSGIGGIFGAFLTGALLEGEKKIVDKRNCVYLSGIVEKEPEFNYRRRGQDYLKTVLTVVRRSGRIDHVPITIPKRICRGKLVGKWIRVKGMMTSYNKRDEEKTHLILSVFADKYEEEMEMPFCTFYENHVALEGYICKEPYYRETPLGREITDVLIAVNRPTWKSDYIPSICWGTIARYAGTLPVGTHVRITGRIQSREYQKQISEEEYETRTAYEVSISQMEVIESEECKDQVADVE